MAITKKSIIDDLVMILTKSHFTDESRLDEDYLSFKIDEVRAELIKAQYKSTKQIDRTWMQHLGLLTFYEVNFADSISLTSCPCDIAKTTLPQIINLDAGGGYQEIGLNLISSCGTIKYYPFPMTLWREVPADHERSLFRYFDRINTDCYINKKDVKQLVGWAILQNPEDAKLIQSANVASGSIVSGTSYTVKYGQIIYDGAVYLKDSTFTGTSATTFTGDGIVYLTSQVSSFRSTDPYPVSGDMARRLVMELLAREYNYEMGVVPDLKDDSIDDAEKTAARTA